MIRTMRKLLSRIGAKAMTALGIEVDQVIPDNVIKQARRQIEAERARAAGESIAHSMLAQQSGCFQQHRPEGKQ